jgi:hypothetical protein
MALNLNLDKKKPFVRRANTTQRGQDIVPPSDVTVERELGLFVKSAQEMGTPVSDLMGTPVSDPMGTPVSDPMGTPVSDPMGTPVSDPMGTPVSDPMGMPVSDPMGMPVSNESLGNQFCQVNTISCQESNSNLADSSMGMSVSDPMGMSVSNPMGMPASDPMGMPASDPMGMPASDPMGVPVSDPMGVPVSDPMGVPVSDSISALLKKKRNTTTNSGWYRSIETPHQLSGLTKLVMVYFANNEVKGKVVYSKTRLAAELGANYNTLKFCIRRLASYGFLEEIPSKDKRWCQINIPKKWIDEAKRLDMGMPVSLE